jgi:hypothetical protein
MTLVFYPAPLRDLLMWLALANNSDQSLCQLNKIVRLIVVRKIPWCVLLLQRLQEITLQVGFRQAGKSIGSEKVMQGRHQLFASHFSQISLAAKKSPNSSTH